MFKGGKASAKFPPLSSFYGTLQPKKYYTVQYVSLSQTHSMLYNNESIIEMCEHQLMQTK